MNIPAEAVQQAIHIAYVAGQRGKGKPTLTWLPPKSGTDDFRGNWIIDYPDDTSASLTR